MSATSSKLPQRFTSRELSSSVTCPQRNYHISFSIGVVLFLDIVVSVHCIFIMADPIIGETFRCMVSHVERKISYLFCFKSSVRNLKAGVEKLTARRDDVMQLIDAAKTNDEVVRKTVEAWLRSVETVLEAGTNLNEKAVLIDRWFKGWIFCSRFSTGKSCQKTTHIIQGLLEDADAFGRDTVADRRLPQDLVSAPLGNMHAIEGKIERLSVGGFVQNMEDPSEHKINKEGKVPDGGNAQNLVLFTEDFEAFGSRVTTAKQVIRELSDVGTTLLGVYGMPGVGKSTLMLALAIYVKEKKIFDEVVDVTLTQTPEIISIQRDIANGLGLKFDDEDSMATRAKRLFQRLCQDRKTLIVLDNLWQEVKLSEVGIPEGLENCKVVFTTRSQDVCNSMGAGESRIKIEVLSPEESWDLFRKKAGDKVDSPAFQGVARDVLNECQGLPLLIVTLGKALYGKDKTYWDAALESLQNSTILPNPIFFGMPQVFSGMKLSYDFLESEEMKFCFLLCCLFPDGYHISMDQLFHYMMGEKILTKASTLQAARLHLHVIVDRIISSCLLLRAQSGCVMMHEVVRDVALAISSEDNGFIVEAGRQLNDWPDRDFADCRRLSLITVRGNHMNWSLPSQIQAAHLLTLSFHGNESLIFIPALFFKETPSLLLPDLSYTGIEVLPQSIMFLTNLRTLLLEGCICLKGVYLSHDMEKLEILSLRYSAIENFVVSQKAITLKQLDLSYTSKLERIRQNIISSFLKLEELYLLNSFRAWEPERTELGESPSKGKDHAEKDEPEGAGTSSEGAESLEDYARLSEVASVRHLTSLEFHIGNLDCLCKSIPNWESLKRFKIAVGVIDDFSPYGISDGMLLEKSMFIELRSKVAANWVKVLLGRTNFLQLKGCQSLSDLAQLDPSSEQQIFLELQVLVLSEIEAGTSLIRCDMLVRLRNLKKLVVANCKYMQKLIDFEVEDQAVFLEACPNTVKFSNLPLSSAFPNLTYLRVCACAELKFVFPMRVVRLLLQLEMLYISDCSNMEMMIEDDADKDKGILPRLRVLSLEGLISLSCILRQDVHLEFHSLEELTVNTCQSLRRLPFGPGSVPKLTKLVVDDYDWFYALKWEDQTIEDRLSGLSNMLHLKGCTTLEDVELLDRWHPTLVSVRVTDFKGATFTPCNFLGKMPHLKDLVIENSQEFQMIDFGEEEYTVEKELHSLGPSSLSANTSKFSKSTPYPMLGNLICLRVSGCSGLKYLCPERVIGGLLQLEKLYIHDCSGMEMVIKHENGDKMVLPKLRILSLESLQRLSCIVLKSGHLELPALEEFKVKECENLMSNLNDSYTPRLLTVLQWDNRKVENPFVMLANCLCLKNINVIDLDDIWYPSLMRSLKVNGYEGETIVHSGLLKRPPNLENLMVFSCHNLKTVIEFGGDTAMYASSSSSVKNKDLSKLSSSLVFSNLTFLHVSGCGKLRFLLPMAVVRHMAQLYTLEVRDCHSMEMIIEYENVEDGCGADADNGVLPALESLTLVGLPQLSSIVGQDILFDWPSLTTISVRHCLALKKLPLGPASVPKLETCLLSPKQWLNELEWEDEQLKLRLQSLPER